MKGINLKSDNSCIAISQNAQTKANWQTSFSFSWLYKVWQKFIYALTSPEELQVWQKRDRFGNTYWEAYDPQTGGYFSSGSEADILAWVEQRYRR
ncbi:hypothetical protein NIES4073_35700 [Kalymmatonema gypsitolerans NIES-4073]|uniref:hypothetical protein n=1 Tax=Scytonema sp. PRP1 TaxID=3120513 RepID=UPI000B614804|nr:hypothetical protein NIES4073_35700 [Scytonema sp. NIES-4073]